MAAEEHFHRVHAIQIVASLPNDLDDALLVLRAAERLVRGFLSVDEPAKKPASIVALTRQK